MWLRGMPHQEFSMQHVVTTSDEPCVDPGQRSELAHRRRSSKTVCERVACIPFQLYPQAGTAATGTAVCSPTAVVDARAGAFGSGPDSAATGTCEAHVTYSTPPPPLSRAHCNRAFIRIGQISSVHKCLAGVVQHCACISGEATRHHGIHGSPAVEVTWISYTAGCRRCMSGW